MAARARNHVHAIAAVLSVVSLALVFGAATMTIPRSALPVASEATFRLIPHLNAAISLLAILVIGYGWLAIRRERIHLHRIAMIAGFVLFVVFLSLYLYRVALLGPSYFPGPTMIERTVYRPVLTIHVLLAVVCVPLLWYVLLLGLLYPVDEIPLTRHPRIGRIAAALWLVSFALGIVVYLLLYHLY